MPSELGNLISRLKHIEEKLIHEEQVLTGIRCEVKDSILIATDLWEKNAQAEMNAAANRQNPQEVGGPRRQSLAQRCELLTEIISHETIF